MAHCIVPHCLAVKYKPRPSNHFVQRGTYRAANKRCKSPRVPIQKSGNGILIIRLLPSFGTKT
jgi:hypothetical protein